MNDPRFDDDQILLYTSTMDNLFHTVHDLLPSVEDETINLDKLKKPHRIYLYGNIGIGKSFHLFALYHRLKQERKDLRILYIQDCQSALEHLKKLSLVLQEVFSGGTAKDQAILDEIKKYLPFSRNVTEIDEIFLLIHKTFGKKFVIIMDQVNALFSPKSEKYSVLKKDLLIDLFGLKKYVTCLISSSANVESPARIHYYVKFADFPVRREFTVDEIKTYFRIFYPQKFFELEEKSLTLLKFHTGFIPLKIATFFNFLQQHGSFSKTIEVFQDYESTIHFKGFVNHFKSIVPDALVKFYDVMLKVLCKLPAGEMRQTLVNRQILYYQDGKFHFISAFMELEYRSFLYNKDGYWANMLQSADRYLDCLSGSNQGLNGSLIECYITSNIHLICLNDRKKEVLTIPCPDSAGNSSQLKLTFGEAHDFPTNIDEKLSGVVGDSSLFPLNPYHKGFDFYVKCATGLHAFKVSITKKPGKFQKSIDAFDKRAVKKDDTLLVEGKYTPVFLMPSSYFAANKPAMLEFEDYKPLFVPPQTFADVFGLNKLMLHLQKMFP